jgi:hypothetical protein
VSDDSLIEVTKRWCLARGSSCGRWLARLAYQWSAVAHRIHKNRMLRCAVLRNLPSKLSPGYEGSTSSTARTFPRFYYKPSCYDRSGLCGAVTMIRSRNIFAAQARLAAPRPNPSRRLPTLFVTRRTAEWWLKIHCAMSMS